MLMYVCVGTHRQKGKSHQLFFISQILFLKNFKWDELISAVHRFKLSVVAFIFFLPVPWFKPV